MSSTISSDEGWNQVEFVYLPTGEIKAVDSSSPRRELKYPKLYERLQAVERELHQEREKSLGKISKVLQEQDEKHQVERELAELQVKFKSMEFQFDKAIQMNSTLKQKEILMKTQISDLGRQILTSNDQIVQLTDQLARLQAELDHRNDQKAELQVWAQRSRNELREYLDTRVIDEIFDTMPLLVSPVSTVLPVVDNNSETDMFRQMQHEFSEIQLKYKELKALCQSQEIQMDMNSAVYIERAAVEPVVKQLKTMGRVKKSKTSKAKRVKSLKKPKPWT